MTITEIAGFITGAVCVYLVVRQSIWNFPVGIANNLFFFILFTQSRLYADAGLQVVYVVLAVLGWYWWLHGGPNRDPLKARHATTGIVAVALATIASGTAFIFWLLHRFTDSDVPFWDALTTAMSLTAQWMLSRKWIENWYLWISVDVIYIGLYIYKGLFLTAVLYAMFIGLCVAGLISWNRSLRAHINDAHLAGPAV